MTRFLMGRWLAGVLVATAVAVPAGAGSAFERGKAICWSLLEALPANPAKCRHVDTVNYTICGVTDSDLFLLKATAETTLLDARLDGVEVGERPWVEGDRVHLLTTRVDGVGLEIEYARGGEVSCSVERPIEMCDRADESLEPRVVRIDHESPFYPELARVARLEATVEIEVHHEISSGEPFVCVRSVSRPGLGFEYAALAALDLLEVESLVDETPLLFDVRFELVE